MYFPFVPAEGWLYISNSICQPVSKLVQLVQEERYPERRLESINADLDSMMREGGNKRTIRLFVQEGRTCAERITTFRLIPTAFGNHDDVRAMRIARALDRFEALEQQCSRH